jgi:hypothetical protein
MTYAQITKVSVEKTKSEIEKTLQQYGATRFISGWDNDIATIGFQFNNRFIKFEIKLPDRSDTTFKKTPSGRFVRTSEDQYKAWEQACRTKWRALYLCIKAKLEAVSSGITTFDSEFLAHIITPSGKTVLQELNNMPQLLLPQ